MKDTIIIHCSATKPSMDIGVSEIRDWHVNGNGWTDVGYAIIIRRSGIVEHGRDLDDDGDVLEEIGAHTFGFNLNSIGICLIGGVDDNGNPDCNFTLAQYNSLAIVVDDIESKLGSMVKKGHRDFNKDTACPTFDVKGFFQKI